MGHTANGIQRSPDIDNSHNVPSSRKPRFTPLLL